MGRMFFLAIFFLSIVSINAFASVTDGKTYFSLVEGQCTTLTYTKTGSTDNTGNYNCTFTLEKISDKTHATAAQVHYICTMDKGDGLPPAITKESDYLVSMDDSPKTLVVDEKAQSSSNVLSQIELAYADHEAQKPMALFALSDPTLTDSDNQGFHWQYACSQIAETTPVTPTTTDEPPSNPGGSGIVPPNGRYPANCVEPGSQVNKDPDIIKVSLFGDNDLILVNGRTQNLQGKFASITSQEKNAFRSDTIQSSGILVATDDISDGNSIVFKQGQLFILDLSKNYYVPITGTAAPSEPAFGPSPSNFIKYYYNGDGTKWSWINAEFTVEAGKSLCQIDIYDSPRELGSPDGLFANTPGVDVGYFPVSFRIDDKAFYPWDYVSNDKNDQLSVGSSGRTLQGSKSLEYNSLGKFETVEFAVTPPVCIKPLPDFGTCPAPSNIINCTDIQGTRGMNTPVITDPYCFLTDPSTNDKRLNICCDGSKGEQATFEAGKWACINPNSSNPKGPGGKGNLQIGSCSNSFKPDPYDCEVLRDPSSLTTVPAGTQICKNDKGIDYICCTGSYNSISIDGYSCTPRNCGWFNICCLLGSYSC